MNSLDEIFYPKMCLTHDVNEKHFYVDNGLFFETILMFAHLSKEKTKKVYYI